jgi:6,7-dimethyl-8-ribityllumazine synthase
VRARFNDALTSALATACLAELAALGVAARHIRQVQVPGALEIPVALKAMAEPSDYDALIALGCIIRGETYHFELVANESGAGVTASRSTTCCRWPTPSSPSRTRRRPGPAPRKRAATPHAWRWRWPT